MAIHSLNLITKIVFIGILLFGFNITLAQSSSEAEQPSLYDRLGGLAPITVVVSDFLDALVPDAPLNANPAIDAARKRVPTPYLKYQVSALVCQVSGGPCQYLGRTMKESHTHLNITETEWARMETIIRDNSGKE